jgi:ATP-dependent Lon protease
MTSKRSDRSDGEYSNGTRKKSKHEPQEEEQKELNKTKKTDSDSDNDSDNDNDSESSSESEDESGSDSESESISEDESETESAQSEIAPKTPSRSRKPQTIVFVVSDKDNTKKSRFVKPATRGRSPPPPKKSVLVFNPNKRNYSRDELTYYNNLDSKVQNQIAKIEKRLNEVDNKLIPARFQLLLSEMDEKSKGIALSKFDAMSRMHNSNSEKHKLQNWLSALTRIPFGKHHRLPVNAESPIKEIQTFLQSTKSSIDERVYGHKEAKEQIMCLLAQWITNPNAKGLTIGIQGSAGVGKTSLVKDGICNALGIPFAFVPLGGASDASYLEGHSYCFEGSTWGKIVDILMKCGCMNPVIFFDELDKVSKTSKGDEIINQLMHLTDSSQNDKIQDKYFVDFDLDLSKSMLIFTYNHEDEINPILRDRMIKIRTKDYTTQEKVEIALNFLTPNILADFLYKPADIIFTHDIIKKLITVVDDEGGVRNLKRSIYELVSKIHFDVMMGNIEYKLPITIAEDHVAKYVQNSRGTQTSSAKTLMMYT